MKKEMIKDIKAIIRKEELIDNLTNQLDIPDLNKKMRTKEFKKMVFGDSKTVTQSPLINLVVRSSRYLKVKGWYVTYEPNLEDLIIKKLREDYEEIRTYGSTAESLKEKEKEELSGEIIEKLLK